MALIADIILGAAGFGAAFYCFILSRRLRKFNDLETGMGGAVAVLSAQVDDLEKSISDARTAARTSRTALDEVTERADGVRRQLELQVASLHDVVPVNSSSADSSPAEPAHQQPQEPMFVRHKVQMGV